MTPFVVASASRPMQWMRALPLVLVIACGSGVPHYGVQSVQVQGSVSCGGDPSAVRGRTQAVLTFRGPPATSEAGYDMAGFAVIDSAGMAHPALCYRQAPASNWQPTVQVRGGQLSSVYTSHSTGDVVVDLWFALPSAPSPAMVLTLGRGAERTDTFRIVDRALGNQ
jgi:hypothetical protein